MPRAIRTPQLNSRAPFSSQSATLAEPMIHDIFEPATGTWQYIVADPATCKAVIIDSVLDYDPATQAITTASADSLLDLVEKHGYQVDRILETHAHADHLTAASYLQRRLAERQGHKPSIGIGKRIDRVQTLFGHRYGVPAEEYQAVFDKLFDDDETFDIGNLQGTAIHLPGHTPDHLGYKIGGESPSPCNGDAPALKLMPGHHLDNVFCGDSLFHPDIGTARCDFPGGDASQLFRSARKLLDMPGHVRIWTGHDYPPEQGRDAVSYLTVDEHRARNKHLADGISEDEYVALRTARDKQMAAPRLLHPSLQINIRSGRLPKPTEAGQRLLHLPVKSDGVQW